MAKIVDDAIGRLPENIQRELNDAWARGLSSPYTRAIDPLNNVLLSRAQTIRGMKAEISALKAQRDELLAALRLIEHATAPTHDDGAYHENAHELARAAIAKATGAARATEGSV